MKLTPHQEKLRQEKRRATIIERYGSWEAYCEFMRECSARIENRFIPPGFQAMTPEQRSAAGKKGAEKKWQANQKKQQI